jgi:hypothetical protein
MRDNLQRHILLSQQQQGEQVSLVVQRPDESRTPLSLVIEDVEEEQDDVEEQEEEEMFSHHTASPIDKNCEVDDIQILLAALQAQHGSYPPPPVPTPFTTTTTEQEAEQQRHHHSVSSSEFCVTDQAMIAVYQLALIHGTTLEFIDELFRLLKRSTKLGFDIMKAPLRRTFMKNLRQKVGSEAPPVPTLVPVPNTRSGMFLPKFNLLDQIKDLIASKDFQILDNLVVNEDPSIRFHRCITSDVDSFLEINSGRWYMDTYDQLVAGGGGGTDEEDNCWMFPLVFYIDKTGTDSLQRFPLEPLMFTSSVLKRRVREKASAWRHVGFVPQCDDAGANPEQVLQNFHHCMHVLLEDLVHLQQSPPTVEVVIDGTKSSKKLILPVAFVMGDQLSQDKHCGRKAINAGGAGKIHRRCMCSYLDACSTTRPCIPVTKLEIDRLVIIACHDKLYMDTLVELTFPGGAGSAHEKRNLHAYLKRRSKCARNILEKVYSTYPINNAWSSVCFGANKEGIYGATLDDPMHYCDAGSFLYLAEVAFRSMTQGERLAMEETIQLYFQGKRSSVREDLPRGKFSAGFTRTTLLTAGEKIGLIFSLFVTLGTEKGGSLFTSVLGRIQRKYEATTPCRSGKKQDPLPQRGDIHFFADLRDSNKSGRNPLQRTLQGVQVLVKSMIQHGLSFILGRVEDLDELQTEYLLQIVSSKLGGFVAPPGVYLGPDHHDGAISEGQEEAFAKSLFKKLRKEQGRRHQPTCSTRAAEAQVDDDDRREDDHDGEEPSKKKRKKTDKVRSLSATAIGDVKAMIPKHELVRPKNAGNGPTSAILTDLDGFRTLLIKALSFHSFVHYFEEVATEKRENIGLMNHFLRDFIGDYSRIVYRGDDTVDCNTPKIHCHLHLAEDIHSFGHPMNWEAGKGERGLKVWAKLASTTAQKVYLPVFTYQTALRVADAMLLSTASSICCAAPKLQSNQPSINRATKEKPIVRMVPHYILNIESRATRYLSRKGKAGVQPETTTPPPFDKQVVQAAISAEAGGLLREIKIWKDAKLMIGDDDKIVRSCSQYDRFGAFFDWVSVQFAIDDDNSCAPAKLLLIYEDSNSELCGIVQACNWRNREEKKASTPLTSRWSMEFLQPSEKPALRKIKLSEISEVLYVIEHSGQHKSQYGLNTPDGCGQRRGPQALRKKYCVDVVEPRYLWAANFLVASRKNGTGGNNSNSL